MHIRLPSEHTRRFDLADIGFVRWRIDTLARGVLFAMRMTRALSRIERLLVPIDFSSYTDAVLSGATTLAKIHNASIDLLHVWRPPFALSRRWDTLPSESDRPSDRELITRYEGALEGARRQVVELGIERVQTRLVQGTASRAIRELTEREPYDMVVMGNHGQTGLPQAYLGSVTERVLRTAAIPVLVIPSHDPDDKD